MKLLKKYVKKANCWLVSWQEIRDRKIIDKREWFIKEIDADNFIKQKNEETKNN